MKKILIGSSRVDEFIKEGDKTLYMDSTMILTPGAKDILRNRGVAIVYGSRPGAEDTASVSCPTEVPGTQETQETQETPENPDNQEKSMASLVETIVGLLRNEFGMNDPETIREISLKVLNKINSNKE
ncbi:MAG: hypothetical protein JEZ12_16660 [Desulfobacterium sp.]|nr:hypothetical protein [Desulfobacterium sp.]